MADSHIGALPQATSVADDALLVMEQQGTAMKLTGAQLKRYAKQGVELEFQEYLDQAQAAAESAAGAVSAVTDMTVDAHASETATVAKTMKDGKVRLSFGLPRGEQGLPGPQGEPGQRGPQGAPGTGLKILGYYDTLDALKAAVPSPNVGDAYGIGTEAPYNIYVFDSVTLAWKDNGQLSGGGGGGPLPESVVTSEGGAEMGFAAAFGDAPHMVEFTDEEEPPLTAEDIQYSTTQNVKQAIEDLKSSVSSGKSLVASAITDKGVPTAQDATFQQMAENIGQISGGSDTSDATATSFDILSPKTAYTAAGKVEGTIPSLAAQTITPGTADRTIANGQYLSGTQTIKGDANLTSGNIKKGVTLFGVEGALETSFKATLTVTADAGAVVTATHSGGTKVEALSTTGTVVLELPLEGTWSVTAVRGVAQYNTVTLNVSSQYSAELTAEVHIEYFGKVTSLSVARTELAGTGSSQYAIFGGGYYSGYKAVSTVDAYDQYLARTIPQALKRATYYLAATTVNDISLFGGGEYKEYVNSIYTSFYSSDMTAYDRDLAKIIPENMSFQSYHPTATTVGEYALFAYGTAINAYDGSLTRTSPTPPSLAHSILVSNENYAVYFGDLSDKVTAYDKNLTRSMPTVLSEQRSDDIAARAGNYALLVLRNSVNAYDLFLTRTIVEKSNSMNSGNAATTVRDFAIFADEGTTVYDPYLTMTIVTGLTQYYRTGNVAASINEYALIAGGTGDSLTPNYDTVEAYRYV